MKTEKELRENYIDSLNREKFGAWLFIIISVIVTILLWIFGNPYIWTLNKKIIATIITLVIFVYGFGFSKIIEADKKLREEGVLK